MTSPTTCTTCGHPAAEPYSSEIRGELCCDPIHVLHYDAEQRAHFDRFRAQLGAGADYRRGSEIIGARVLASAARI